MAGCRGNFGGWSAWMALIGVAGGAIALPHWSAGAQAQRLGQPPVAAFTWSFCPSMDAPVIFDATESRDTDGEIVRYTWDFGDGATGEGKIIEHDYGQDTAFIVRLTVVDNDALVNELERHVTVIDLCRDVPFGRQFGR